MSCRSGSQTIRRSTTAAVHGISPKLRRRANSSRGKKAKSTGIAKQSQHNFLKGRVTRLKEALQGVVGRLHIYAFFTCFFLHKANTIRPVIAKESSVDACSSSGSPMPASAGKPFAR
jgi:hypothetical protein